MKNAEQEEKEFFAKTIVEASNILARIGWSIAIPRNGDLNHMVVGDIEALEDILHFLGPEYYDVMEKEGH